MERIFELPTKYYALFYKDCPDYEDLQNALKESGEIDTDERIALLLKHATAAVYIGELTSNQVTVFDAEIIKQRRELWEFRRTTIKLVPKLLIPDNTVLQLQILLNNKETDWNKQQDVVAGIAEQIRQLDYGDLMRQGAESNSEMIIALKRAFEERQKQVSKQLIEEEDAALIQEHRYTLDELNEISLTEHNGRGWSKLAVLKLQREGKPCTKNDVKCEARNIQNRIEAHRKKQKPTS